VLVVGQRLRAVASGLTTRSALAPLKHSVFRRIALAYTINELGNWLGDLALAVLVYDGTGSALATAALFLGAKFIPGLVGPALTTRIESIDGRRSLPTLYALEAIAFGVLALLSHSFSLPLFLVIAAIDGTLAVASRALSRTATVGVLKPVDQVRQGNAVLNVGVTAGAALGPAFAGALIATVGAGAALAVDAGSFALAAVALLGASSLPVTSLEESPDPWTDRLRAGVRHAWSSLPLRALLGGQAVALVFFAAVIPIEVVFAKATLHSGSAGYGALLASWGGGMILGNLVFALAHRVRVGVVLAVGTVAIGAGYVGIGAAPTLFVACVASAVGGAGNGVQWVALLTAVQNATSARFLARIMALLESIGTIMPGLGYVLGGAIAAAASPRATYATAGVAILLIVVVATPIVLRAQRQPPRPRPEADRDEPVLPD
jgi:MFS family permease